MAELTWRGVTAVVANCCTALAGAVALSDDAAFNWCDGTGVAWAGGLRVKHKLVSSKPLTSLG